MNSLIRFFYPTFLTTVLCSEESREFLLDVSSLLTDYIVRSWLEIRVTRPTILNMHTIAYIMHAGGLHISCIQVAHTCTRFFSW